MVEGVVPPHRTVGKTFFNVRGTLLWNKAPHKNSNVKTQEKSDPSTIFFFNVGGHCATHDGE